MFDLVLPLRQFFTPALFERDAPQWPCLRITQKIPDGVHQAECDCWWAWYVAVTGDGTVLVLAGDDSVATR